MPQITLLEASAGSGKTYQIAEKIYSLITKDGIQIHEIAVLSFSREAARKLSESIHKKFMQHFDPNHLALVNCIHHFNRNVIATIQSFFYKILYMPEISAALNIKISPKNSHKHTTRFLLEDIFDYFEANFSQNDARWHFYQKILFSSNNSIEKGISKTLANVRNVRSLEKNIILARPISTNIQGVLKKIFSLKNSFSNEPFGIIRNSLQRIHDLLQSTPLSNKNLVEEVENLLFSPTTKSTSLLREMMKSTPEDFKTITELLDCVFPSGIFSEKNEKLLSDCEEVYAIKYNLQQSIHLIETKKILQGNLDQNDIVRLIYTGMQDARIAQTIATKISEQIKIIIIDEFQDTNFQQWCIIKTICDNQKIPLFLVGDPKQCIYGFRGGNIYTYVEAKKCVSPDALQLLGSNYRSSPKVIAAINYIFSNIFSTKTKSEVLYKNTACGMTSPNSTKEIFIDHQSQPGCTLMKILSTEETEGKKNPSIQEIRTITNHTFATEIQTLLQQGTIQDSQNTSLTRKIEPSDICILCSNNNACVDIQDILNSYHIPNILTSKGTIFQTYECLAMEDLLEALSDPLNRNKIKLVLLGLFFGLPPNIVYVLEKTGKIAIIFETFLRWQKRLDSHGILSIFEEICHYGKILGDLLAEYLDAEKRYILQLPLLDRIFTQHPPTHARRRWINIQHIFEFVTHVQKEYKIPPRKLAWHINYERDLYEYGTSETDFRYASLKPLEKENCVQIMTVHKSKGLEFGIVFLMVEIKDTSHQRNKSLFTNPLYFDTVTQTQVKEGISVNLDSLHKEKSENQQELLRLFYVACTRAKYKLYIPIIYTKGVYKETYSINKLCTYFIQDTFGDINSPVTELKVQEFCKKNPIEFSYGSDYAPSSSSISRKEFATQKSIEKISAEKTERCSLSSNFFYEKKIHFGSFSSLSYSLKKLASLKNETNSSQMTAHEYDDPTEKTDEPNQITPHMTGGILFGNLMHKLLECIDFSAVISATHHLKLLENPICNELIQTVCIKFYPQDWFEPNKVLVASFLWNAIHKKIYVEGSSAPIVLGKIPFAHRKSELKFTLKVDRLEKYLYKYISTKKISFPVQNILSGFIDCTFMHEEKYYVLDWKTNYLGDTPEDYHKELLHKEMVDCLYHIQSTLYISALCAFLQSTQKNFSYKKNIGGCLYLFIRGIRATHSDQYGIYHHIPPVQDLFFSGTPV